MSAVSLLKLTKTQVKFLDDVGGLINMIRSLSELCKLFFGGRRIPVQGLCGIIVKFQDNKRLLLTQHLHNLEFFAKVLFSIDHRLYQ